MAADEFHYRLAGGEIVSSIGFDPAKQTLAPIFPVEIARKIRDVWRPVVEKSMIAHQLGAVDVMRDSPGQGEPIVPPLSSDGLERFPFTLAHSLLRRRNSRIRSA